jgi:hypothetical protein
MCPGMRHTPPPLVKDPHSCHLAAGQTRPGRMLSAAAKAEGIALRWPGTPRRALSTSTRECP